MLKKSERKLIFYNFEIIIKLLFDANTSSTMKKMVVNKIKNEINQKDKDYFVNRKNIIITHIALNNLDILNDDIEEKLFNIAQELESIEELNYKALKNYCKDEYQYEMELNYIKRIKTQQFIQKIKELKKIEKKLSLVG